MSKASEAKDVSFKHIWETLAAIDCSGHTEQKNTGRTTLTYLSWTWAWTILMKHYPTAVFEVREWDGKPWLHDPVAGYLVSTSVSIEGHTRSMWLPVMDGANMAMKDTKYQYQTKYDTKTVNAVDMMAINKTIMRCLVKNLALFGLGINIYAGEDLPVLADEQPAKAKSPLLGTTKKRASAEYAWKLFTAKHKDVATEEVRAMWRSFISNNASTTDVRAIDGDEWEVLIKKM